jgi:hypothetical protein
VTETPAKRYKINYRGLSKEPMEEWAAQLKLPAAVWVTVIMWGCPCADHLVAPRTVAPRTASASPPPVLHYVLPFISPELRAVKSHRRYGCGLDPADFQIKLAHACFRLSGKE